MADRLAAHAAALLVEWYGARTGRDYAFTSSIEGAVPAFVAEAGDSRIAFAVAQLWEAADDPASELARARMEERLDAGSVHGPFMLWTPPRASLPSAEPEASDFVQRVQRAAAPLRDGGRAEVEFPVPIQLGKLRDEGGYASVTGGLGRWWTLITERVNGTFQVNSARMRRAPQSAEARERLFERIGQASQGLNTGDAVEIDATEAWTLQRLAHVPPGATGFAIAMAPPKTDPADGTLLRRLVRKRLKDASAAVAGIDADVTGVALVAIYEYAEHENIGSFVKSLDPSLYAPFQLVAAIADGEVRPIFQPR